MKTEKGIFYEYYFKGSRNYVHGTTIFESFCNVLRDRGITLFRMYDLKFYQEMYNNGRIIIGQNILNQNNLTQKNLKTSMSLIVKDKPLDIYLFDDSNSKVVERRKDLTHTYIKEVLKTKDYESESRLINIDNFVSLVTALVEVNKQTHIKTLGDTGREYKYRWVFSKDFFVGLNLKIPTNINVQVKHLGLKKDKDGKTYTFNKINFLIGDTKYQLAMCFIYFKR